jgi:hypothetical protein
LKAPLIWKGTARAIVAGCFTLGLLPGCASHAGHRTAGTPEECGPPVPGQEGLSAAVVVLGETHGTVEIPALFGRLVCHAATRRRPEPIVVGLEIWTSAQTAIDSFLDGAGGEAARRSLLEPEFWRRDFQDGRSSAAMVDLLEALRRQRAAGLKLVVRALDPPQFDSPGDRDAHMAAAVIEAIQAHRPAQTLLLVGDVHSRVLPGYPWEPSAAYLSVGTRLRERYADTVGLRPTSAGGSSWMCLSKDGGKPECGVHPIRAREIVGEVPRIALEPGALETTGWSGTLLLGTLTASPPAR